MNLKPRTQREGDPAPVRAQERKSDDDDDPYQKEPAKPAGKQTYVPPSQRRKEEAAPPRKDEEEDADGFKEVTLKTSKSGYEPPAKRKAREEEEARRKAEEEKEEKRRQAEADRKRQAAKEQEEKDEAERLEKQKKKEAKKEKKAAKEEERDSKEDKKKDKKDKENPDDKKAADEERKLAEFGEKCEEAVSNKKANIEKFAGEVTKLLSEEQLGTVRPVGALIKPLLAFCRQKTEAQVVEAVERFSPLFLALIEAAGKWRFKVQVLIEAQRLAYEIGLPRLSPSSALLEVFFDGLYRAGVIEEQYFSMWSLSEDDTPGKISASFQLQPFLDFLKSAPIDGESDSEGEDDRLAESDSESEEEEDYFKKR